MTSVSTLSAGMALLALRGRLGGGADDPAAEGGEIALLGAEAAIDQVPAHAFRDAQRKRRNKPARDEVIVDIGADAHGDAEPVDSRLQGVAVILKLRAARGDARQASSFQPLGPILGGVRDAGQARSFEVA